VRRRLVILIGGTLAAWLAVLLPARLLGGDQAVIFSLTAAVLCLAPATATLIWACLTWGRSPSQQFKIMVGGTGLRVCFVMATGLLIYQFVLYFHQVAFWVWIPVFYLITLGLETALVRGLKPGNSAA
jgi:hypothetical protein